MAAIPLPGPGTPQDDGHSDERLVTLGRGQSLTGLLDDQDIGPRDRGNIVAALQAPGVRKHSNLRSLRPGTRFTLTLAPEERADAAGDRTDAPSRILKELSFSPGPALRIVAWRGPDGLFQAEAREIPLTGRTRIAMVRIMNSLFRDGSDIDIPAEILAGATRLLSNDVDFQRDIMPGSIFEVMFEERLTGAGQVASTSAPVYIRLDAGGNDWRYYRYTPGDDGVADYFDEHGESVGKQFLRTPVDGARLSSGFGMRRHPIYGYTRKHEGIDFAARTGTPVYAAASGVVSAIRSTRRGYGKHVILKHPGEYRTLYAHLSRFRKGLQVGQRVRKGDVIGRVGSTGDSTGPHLHYELIAGGRKVDPKTVSNKSGRRLTGKELARFREIVSAIRQQVAQARPPSSGDRQSARPEQKAGGHDQG